MKPCPSVASPAAAALALFFIGVCGSTLPLVAATDRGRAVRVVVSDALRTGEICFQQAGRSVTLFPGGFPNDEVTCQPATADLLLRRSGRFLITSRVAGKYVSRPALVQVSGEDAERSEVALDAFRAGSLMFDRSQMKIAPQAQLGVLVVRPPDGGRAFALVLQHGAAQLTVPAETPVLPIALLNGVPVAIGAMQTVAAGATKTVNELPRRGRAVFASTHLWRGAGDALPETPPQIVLEREDGFRYAPSGYGEGKESVALYDEGVVVFLDVPRGRYDLVVRGHSWRRDVVAVAVSDTSISVPRKSVIIAPGTPIAVRAMARIPAQQNICGVLHPATPPRRQLQLKRCPDAATAAEHPARCLTIDERWLHEETAHFFADDGDYVLTLTIGDVESHKVLRVGSEPVDTTLELSPLTIAGRITRGGDGLRAHVTIGMSNAGSDDGGNYAMDLQRGTGAMMKVVVRPCNDSFVYEKPIHTAMLSSGRLDVDVPATELSVRVLHGPTATAVDAAVVDVERLAADSRFERVDQVSVADGRHSFFAYDREVSLRVCAVATGYARACSEPFEFGTSDRREIELILQPVSR